MLFKTGLLVALLFAAGPSNPQLKTADLRIINREGRVITVTAEIAASDAERTLGLMNRESLGKDSGMLFIFSREEYLNFWMKNTSIPLSIAYIDSKGIIREIQDMAPLDTSLTYPSRYPVRYALEVNKGWFNRNNIEPGNRVILDEIRGR
jgi:uncharacterized protein